MDRGRVLMNKTQDEVKDLFLKDVAKHTMRVLHDDGCYRHLEFSHNGSPRQKFSLVTYPNHLVFSGDMGTYVFSRLNDMFEFFRNDKDLGINAGYWSGKVEAVSKDGGLKVHSEKLVEASIASRVEDICDEIGDWFEDNDNEDIETVEAFEAAFRKEIEGHFRYEELDKFRYISAIESFDSNIISKLDFTDCWEWMDSEALSYRYLWCCYAIVWGIKQYDQSRGSK